jgi:hypothetical protein
LATQRPFLNGYQRHAGSLHRFERDFPRASDWLPIGLFKYRNGAMISNNPFACQSALCRLDQMGTQDSSVVAMSAGNPLWMIRTMTRCMHGKADYLFIWRVESCRSNEFVLSSDPAPEGETAL